MDCNARRRGTRAHRLDSFCTGEGSVVQRPGCHKTDASAEPQHVADGDPALPFCRPGQGLGE